MLLTVCTQGVTDEYGTDWNGPASIEDDDNTVIVNGPPDLLSDAEKIVLMHQLQGAELLREDAMLHDFTVAKLFVPSASE